MLYQTAIVLAKIAECMFALTLTVVTDDRGKSEEVCHCFTILILLSLSRYAQILTLTLVRESLLHANAEHNNNLMGSFEYFVIGDATRVCPPQQKVNTSTNNMQRWLPQRSVPATTCCGRCRGDRPSLSSTYRWREGHMTCPVFAYVANEESHGAGPNIDYTVTALRPHTSSKSNPLNTPANQRARAGFIYWWFPRPKPTKCQ